MNCELLNCFFCRNIFRQPPLGERAFRKAERFHLKGCEGNGFVDLHGLADEAAGDRLARGIEEAQDVGIVLLRFFHGDQGDGVSLQSENGGLFDRFFAGREEGEVHYCRLLVLAQQTIVHFHL